ncbi:hypothetical protein HC891_27105 [Candidatus Gracilibacteria bacterium]|nr:hypothetical protein [Candidatus Gracilibacteria bacterium]
MGEVRLAALAGLVDLLEADVVVGAVESTPGGDVALEAAQLARGVALRIALGEDGKERSWPGALHRAGAGVRPRTSRRERDWRVFGSRALGACH